MTHKLKEDLSQSRSILYGFKDFHGTLSEIDILISDENWKYLCDVDVSQDVVSDDVGTFYLGLAVHGAVGDKHLSRGGNISITKHSDDGHTTSTTSYMEECL